MSDQKDMQTIAKAKGRPMLTWVGKKPLDKIEYFPAQEKEVYGDLSATEFNKLFWGDNLQVLSHMLRDYRGKIDLIYIDPPFDSKADYVKKVKVRGEQIEGEQKSLLEEKQYGDIWENDEYLQFMYERLLILKELLSDVGVIYLHCDHHKEHLLRCLLDEIFGENNFLNVVSWRRGVVRGKKVDSHYYPFNKDTILIYSNNAPKAIYNIEMTKGVDRRPEADYKKFGYKKDEFGYYIDSARNDYTDESVIELNKQNRIYVTQGGDLLIDDGKVSTSKGMIRVKAYREVQNDYILEIKHADNIWDDIRAMGNNADDTTDYPTQKPESLLEKIISVSSNPGDLILDCFCGSGTTLAVAQKLGRRWIGCDINIGAIQTTTKRLSQILQDQQTSQPKLTEGDFKGLNAFKVLNVNNYDIFKNELEAKEIVMDVYGVDPIKQSYFDGMLDNNFVKVLPLNRVLNKHDITLLLKNINDSIDGFTVKPTTATGEHLYEEGVVVICSGVELDAEDFLKKQNGTGVPISIKNILRDKQNLVFKQKPEAEIQLSVDGKKLTVEVVDFYSPILMRRLELENKKVIDSSTQAKVEDFHQIIDSVAIDIDYNGELFNAEIMDLPDKKSVIAAKYEHEYSSKGKKKIAIKIVDVLGEEYFESFDVEVGV